MSKRRLLRPILPFAFFGLPLVLLGMFFFWLFTVFLPVMVIEAQYQYHAVLREVFHTESLRGVFIPNFRVDLRGKSARYDENGVYIPKIAVDAPIVYNVDPNDERAYTEALKKGIAHASGTSLPDTGGLGYYFAHSSTPAFVTQYNAIFYLLGKLEIGDEIFIWHLGKRYMYRVTEKRETTPEDTSYLKESHEKETIVFQTCWPPGTSWKRLLIFAERDV